MTNSEEVLDLIKARVGEYKMRGNETVFKECPFCGNTKANFELNMVKGVFHCWVCSESGGVRWLLRRLGINYSGELPVYHKKIEAPPIADGELKLPVGVMNIGPEEEFNKVRGYLGSRGITKEDIKTYEILWWKGEGRVLFPFRNSVGNLIFWTARVIFKNIRPKYMHAAVPKTDRIIMYYGHDEDTIFIVEGVFDAIRVHKMGHAVIILMGSDISSVTMDYLRAKHQKVCLVLDNDMLTKQREYADELGKSIGFENVSAVFLPNSDVADIGVPLGYEGFSGYIKSRLGTK